MVVGVIVMIVMMYDLFFATARSLLILKTLVRYHTWCVGLNDCFHVLNETGREQKGERGECIV